LNPATNATFELLDDLLQDLTGGIRGSGLFYDNVIHLGGDEVNTACYESTPSIKSWLDAKGLDGNGGYEVPPPPTPSLPRSFPRRSGWHCLHFIAVFLTCLLPRCSISSSSTRPSLTPRDAMSPAGRRSGTISAPVRPNACGPWSSC